jgi:EAL domain-containing protein (putative c-di-GMP-specific phosphodiesterase class I)
VSYRSINPSVDPSRRRSGDGERPLGQYLQGLAREGGGRLAVHLRLSRLLPYNRGDRGIRAATACFADLVGQLRAELFMLRNNDILLFFLPDAEGLMKTAVHRLRLRFADDPLIKTDAETGALAAWFDTSCDLDAICELVATLSASPSTTAPQPGGTIHRVADAPRTRRKRETPLTLEWLARLETALSQTDVASLLRQHWVCRWEAGAHPERRFSELSVSLMDLATRVLPDVDLRSNPWLFQHLTETFDRRMLAMLVRPGRGALPAQVCINLNVSTILSEDFVTFDDKLPTALRGKVVVELRAADIFADLEAYHFVRRYVQSRGYRVSIDGITYRSIQMLKRDLLHSDFVKLDFTGEMFDDGAAVCETLAKVVAQHNPESIILAMVETGQALMLGQKAGILNFQGNYVDHALVAEQPRHARPLARPIAGPVARR